MKEQIQEPNNKVSERWEHIRWVFILQRVNTEQIKKIYKFYPKNKTWNKICGGIEDYFLIMNSFLNQDPKLKIYLVVDYQNYLNIFYYKFNYKQEYQSMFKRVYIFPYNRIEKLMIAHQTKHNPLIRDTFDDFKAFIEMSLDQIQAKQEEIIERQKLKQKNKDILINFNLIGEKDSNEIRVKILSFINLQQKYFEEYLQKFKKSFQQYFPAVNLSIFESIEQAIKLLKINEKTQFYTIILRLYKQQNNKIYQFINNKMKRLKENNINWDQIALPIYLIYKAIKFYYQNIDNRQRLNSLFDQNGQCIVWRIAWMSQLQIQNMRERLNQDNQFYELGSFTSTSLSKQRVQRSFLQVQNLHKSCLMKFHIKKPTFQNQIDYLSFIYQSFAIIDDQNNQRDEKEVLLNTLTVCKIENIGVEAFEQIKRNNIVIQKEIVKQYWQQGIPLIDITVLPYFHQPFLQKGQFNKIQNEIINKKQKEPIEYLADKLQVLSKPIQSYLIIIDLLKNHQKFNIGHARAFFGQYQEALQYLQKRLQIEHQQTPNLIQICNIYIQMADIHQKMGNTKQSIQKMQQSMKVAYKIKQTYSNIALRDKHSIISKIIEKLTYILHQNNLPNTCLLKINNQLLQLQKDQNKSDHIQKPANSYFHAQKLMIRGLLEFCHGDVESAQKDISQSKRKIQEILQKIDYYQKQINQNTYLDYIKYAINFIVHLFLGKYLGYSEFKSIENFEKLAYIFGAQVKLNQFKQKYRFLEDSIKKFAQKHKQSFKQDMIETKQYKQILTRDTQKRYQNQISWDQITFGVPQRQILTKQVKELFEDFQKKVKQNSPQNIYNKLKQSIQTVLLTDVTDVGVEGLITFQENITKYKKAFCQFKLRCRPQKTQQKINYYQQQEKISNLILCKRNQIKQLIEINLKKGCTSYFIRSLQLMKNSPSQKYSAIQNLMNRGYQIELQEYLGMGRQEMININNTIKKYQRLNTHPTMIQIYLKKINLVYTQCQVDFQYSIQKIGDRYRQIQLRQIEICQNTYKQLKQLLAKYKQSETIIKSQSEIDKENKKQFVAQKQIQIELWKIKLQIMKTHVKNEIIPSSQEEKKMKQINDHLINLIEPSIDKLAREDIKKRLKSEYLQTHSILLYFIRQVMRSMKELNDSLLIVKDRRKRIYLVTKFIFIFQKHKDELGIRQQHIIQIVKNYQLQGEVPLFWRICLAYHFHFYKYGTIRTLSDALSKCIKILQTQNAEKCQLIKQLQQKRLNSFTRNNTYFLRHKHKLSPGCLQMQKKQLGEGEKTNDHYFINDFNRRMRNMQRINSGRSYLQPISRKNSVNTLATEQSH